MDDHSQDRSHKDGKTPKKNLSQSPKDTGAGLDDMKSAVLKRRADRDLRKKLHSEAPKYEEERKPKQNNNVSKKPPVTPTTDNQISTCFCKELKFFLNFEYKKNLDPKFRVKNPCRDILKILDPKQRGDKVLY